LENVKEDGSARLTLRETIGRFTAIFEEVPESQGGGYVARVEELPGAISQGDTLDEARENLRDAIAMVVKDEQGSKAER
jgi:predicted RNase H-like HicB family nuclease